MSFFLAAIYDRFMAKSERAALGEWRRALLAPLAGHVLEVGAGTGVNLAHYPGSLARLVLAEPDPYMRRRLAPRARERGAEVLDASAEELPIPDASFDAVVSTLVLCSVSDPERALAEVRRVLRPGGRLVFIEHVAAWDRPDRLRWQRRLEPFWKRIAGNCHLTRTTAEAIERAGFELLEVKRESMRKALPWVRPSVRGIAVKPRAVEPQAGAAGSSTVNSAP